MFLNLIINVFSCQSAPRAVALKLKFLIYSLFFQRFAGHWNCVRIRTKASDWTGTYPPRFQITPGWLLATLWDVAGTWHDYWCLKNLRKKLHSDLIILYSIYFKRLYILTRNFCILTRMSYVCASTEPQEICTKMTVLLCTMNKTLSRLHSTQKWFNISFLHWKHRSMSLFSLLVWRKIY